MQKLIDMFNEIIKTQQEEEEGGEEMTINFPFSFTDDSDDLILSPFN
jgi:hypothetical protein